MKNNRRVRKFKFPDPTENFSMNDESLEKNKKERGFESKQQKFKTQFNKRSNTKENDTNNLFNKIKQAIKNFGIDTGIDDLILIGLIAILVFDKINDKNESDTNRLNDIDLILIALVYLLM